MGRKANWKPWIIGWLDGPGGNLDDIDGPPLLVTWPNRGERGSFRDLEDESRDTTQLGPQPFACALRLGHATAEQVLLRVPVGERGDEPVRDEEDGGAGVELRVRQQLAHELQAELPRLPRDPNERVDVRFAGFETRAVGEAQHVRARNQVIEERVDDAVDRRTARRAHADRPEQRVPGAVAQPREDRLPELALAAPVVVDGAERNAGAPRHLAGRPRRVARLREVLLGGIEDAGRGAAGVVEGFVDHVLPHWSIDLVIRPISARCQPPTRPRPRGDGSRASSASVRAAAISRRSTRARDRFPTRPSAARTGNVTTPARASRRDPSSVAMIAPLAGTPSLRGTGRPT